jgi:glutamate synthase domain-containing protein 3
MTGGLAYILDEDDTLVPKVCKLRAFDLHFVLHVIGALAV